jgi:hypothetical protein
MSQFSERIKADPVWQILQSFGSAIDAASKREDINAESIDNLERLKVVLTFCGKRLASADPYLMEPPPLAKINGAWTAAQAEIDKFAADGNVSHLATANTQADTVLRILSTVVAPVNLDDLGAIRESATAYRNTLNEYLEETTKTNSLLKNSSAEVLSRLTELGTEIFVEKQKISNALSDLQSQFAIGQTNRNAEFATAQAERQASNAASLSQVEKSFAEAQAERQAKYSQSLAEHQAQFTAAQEERVKSDNEAQTDRQAKFSSLMIDYAQKLSEQKTQFTTQMETSNRLAQEALAELKAGYEKSAQSILDEINMHRLQVEKLVGVIGNLGVTSGYQITANHARVALYIWQGLTVIALGGFVWVAQMIAFAPSTASGDQFMQGLATRVFLSIAIGVFAAYAASQAEKASVVERKNRKLALELEAVGPYIAPLPEDMQNKFRADLGERSFGVPEVDPKRHAEPARSPTSALDVLQSKELREGLEELVDKVLKARKTS